jgi:hypothetical protein
MLELMRERYRGTLIIAGGFDYDTAEGWLRQGAALQKLRDILVQWHRLPGGA